MLKITPQNNNIQKQQLSNVKNRITPNNNLSLKQDTVSFGGNTGTLGRHMADIPEVVNPTQKTAKLLKLLQESIQSLIPQGQYNPDGIRVLDNIAKLYPEEKNYSEQEKEILNNIYQTTTNKNIKFRLPFINNIQTYQALDYNYNREERASLETINEIFQKVDADATGNVKMFLCHLMEDKQILPYISPKDILEYINNINIKEINNLEPEAKKNILSIISYAKVTAWRPSMSGVAYDSIINAQANKNAINMINSELDNISQKESTGFFSRMKKFIPFFNKEEKTPTKTPPYSGSSEIKDMSTKDYMEYLNSLNAFLKEFRPYDRDKLPQELPKRILQMEDFDPTIKKRYSLLFKYHKDIENTQL